LDVKVLSGIEWTTFDGHIVVTGGNSKVDWRDVNAQNVDEKIAEAVASGDAVTLAHPRRPGAPMCYGCWNNFNIKRWENVHAYEIWTRLNPMNQPMNLWAKKDWVSLLDDGYKIAAAYGYDWHRPDEGCPPYAATYVGVEGELNEQNLVAALKARRTYVSLGVELYAELKSGGKTYGIGDDVPIGNVEISVKAYLNQYYSALYTVKIEKIRLVGTAASFEVSGDKISVSLPLKRGHVRIEVLGRVNGEYGEIAVTSPFFAEEL
jgi:hypothetical protein